jgi:RNase H-like domain found in reverse transcriptase
MMPDHLKPFQIQVDSSLFATGDILIQTDTNRDRHPCAYLFKSLTKKQRNYDIEDRELLAIVRALKEWRHYIQGSGHTTLIHTDHRNLTYFRKAQKLSDRQARWSLFLSSIVSIRFLVGSGAGLSVALSKSESPEVRGSGFGFCSGGSSGVDLFPGAEN